MSKPLDLSDRIFGKLCVRYQDKNYRNERKWICECECGKFISVRTHSLIIGKTRSCGCLKIKGCGNISGDFWSKLRYRAKSLGHDFDITIEYISSLFDKQNKRCVISGEYIFLNQNKRLNPDLETTASLDRIDSSKGYIEGNVQWVHKTINRMKLDFTTKELLHWCNLVINPQKTDKNYIESDVTISKLYKRYKLISRRFFNKIHRSAKQRKIPFSISIEEIWDIFVNQNGKCAITNISLVLGPQYYNFSKQTASLDRIDSNKGYFKENVQWVHKDINCMKWQLSTKEFISWCTKINNYKNNI